MNKYVIIILLFLVVGCEHEPTGTTEPFSKKATYTITNGREIYSQEDWLDSSGNIIRTINFGNRNRDTLTITNYIFSGELLTNVIVQKPDGKQISNLCHYYTLGKLAQSVYIQGSDTLSKTIYNYYDNGDLQREIIVYPLTKINPITVVKLYDMHGNIEKIYNQIYEDSTKLVWARYEMQSFNNIYNQDNQLTQTTTTYLFGYYEITDTISVVQFRYNADKTLAAKINTQHAANDNTDSVNYFYNNNLLEKSITYFNSTKKAAPFTDTAFYTYDSKNRLIGQMNSLSGTGYRFEYANQ